MLHQDKDPKQNWDFYLDRLLRIPNALLRAGFGVAESRTKASFEHGAAKKGFIPLSPMLHQALIPLAEVICLCFCYSCYMKTVLFVPGFREDLKSRDYYNVIKAIEGKGYNVIFVPIKWVRTTINEWISELDIEYAKHSPNETILAGFSFGSMTAFLSATKKNPRELWLFSLSPYFAEDMPKMKKSWLRDIGSHRANEFRLISFREYAKKINCKTLIFVGEIEAKKYPLIGERSKEAKKYIVGSQIIWVKDTDHDVAATSYIDAITMNI